MKAIYTITIVKDDEGVMHLGIPGIPVENKKLTYYEVMGALECIKIDLRNRAAHRAKDIKNKEVQP